MTDKDLLNVLLPVLAACEIVGNKKIRKKRGPDRFRENVWWKNGYQHWSEEEFNEQLRI